MRSAMSLDTSYATSGAPPIIVSVPRKPSSSSSSAASAGTAPTALQFGDSHSIASDPSPKAASVSTFWANLKRTEVERAKAGEYQPATKATEIQIRLAALEFERRVEQPNVPDIPWVLVATQCEDYPSSRNVNNAIIAAGSPSIGSLSFFLANDKSLYIISYSDKVRHGAGVDVLMDAMTNFRNQFFFFHCHTNVVAEVENGRTAPDGALRVLHPMQNETGRLRAPFIAEIHSAGKSVAGSLLFASNYMKEPLSDYFLYIHAYKRQANGTFRAVAILWRRGGGPPLVDGQMANLVTAQSFGTADLHPATIESLADDHGHLPGVPAHQLVHQDPPVNIVVPRAELLRNVVDEHGNPVSVPQVGADGNPVLDANGHPTFLVPQGDDLVVNLFNLRRLLNFLM